MVLKYKEKPNDVFILEVSPDDAEDGISIKPWSEIRSAVESGEYKKVTLRHLFWDRPDSSVEIMEEFVKGYEGEENDASKEKFSIIGKESLKKQSIVQSSKMEVNEERVFFSSELIANAYIVANITKITAKTNLNFQPVNWTSDK